MAKLKVSKHNVEVWSIQNDFLYAELGTFGARLLKLLVKDENGRSVDVVAGFDDPGEYFDDHGTYFGATVGRVANRIGKARFLLGGKEYPLFKNDGNNHLHGGERGFDKRFWRATQNEENSISFDYLSRDMEEGYPGNLAVKVTYTLKDNSLFISYAATTDKDTPASFTNHTYFNLSGVFDTNGEHVAYINADKVTEIDDELIPNGNIVSVKGTPLDFSVPKPIGRDIDADFALLKIANGYDFNYILNDAPLKAFAYSKKSGIKMSVYTDLPCMQFYSGNFLDGFMGKQRYPFRSAFCFETQKYPNAVNIESFESCILKAGEKFKSETQYKFEIAGDENGVL